jgi:hypothetical protein
MSSLGDAETIPSLPTLPLPAQRKLTIIRKEQPNGEAGVRFSLMEVAKMITESRLSPQVRAWTMRRLAEKGNPKGPLARAEVLWRATQGNVPQGRWAPDPTDAELIPSADLMISTCKDDKIAEDGSCPLGELPPYFALGDCFAEGTMLLTKDAGLVPIEKVGDGREIWGLDSWTTVERVAYKSQHPVDLIRLANGGELQLTSEHHVYVLDCTEHPMLTDDVLEPKARAEDPNVRPCPCGREHRVEKRPRVLELRAGMVMTAPSMTRSHAESDGQGMRRVARIDRNVDMAQCWDITTTDHRVYLPQQDVTVSQCDDLVVQFGATALASIMMLAAAGNVGVYGAVVGHAYNEEKNIQHVLAAIFAEGKWHYVDPSLPELAFGKCKPFTRERIIYVPSLEVGCDADVCLAPGGRASGPPPFAARGDFVGVSGPGDDIEDLVFEKPDGVEPLSYAGADDQVGVLGRYTTEHELSARATSASRSPALLPSHVVPGAPTLLPSHATTPGTPTLIPSHTTESSPPSMSTPGAPGAPPAWTPPGDPPVPCPDCEELDCKELDEAPRDSDGNPSRVRIHTSVALNGESAMPPAGTAAAQSVAAQVAPAPGSGAQKSRAFPSLGDVWVDRGRVAARRS